MRHFLGIALPALALSAAAPVPTAAQNLVTPPWDTVATILESPALPAAGYIRYNLPRRDFTVRMGGVALAVPLAGGAWVGFAGTARDAVVMGDLVVTREELGPVEAALLGQRLDVTGIHDHLVGEGPRLVYLHFHGDGKPVDLARRLDSVLARTGTPRPVAAARVPPVTIDTALVFRALGPSGRAQGSVAQLTFQLVTKRVRWHGRTLPPALAAATTVNIQAVNPSRAVASGDVAVLEPQVGPVLRAMISHGIVAEALHTHMVGEEPPVYFIHFWADGPLATIVGGLKAALDAAK